MEKVIIMAGFISFIFGRTQKYAPYRDRATNKIYNLLFCDDLGLYKNKNSMDQQYPWSTLFQVPIYEEQINKVLSDTNVESRIKILAYNILAEKNMRLPEKVITFGTIIEVGLDKGLDVLAVYRDGSARYINHTEKMIIWEPSNEEVFNQKVKELFEKSELVVSQIGPWEKERLQPPVKGRLRLTFLTSNGLYFGEGPIDVLAADNMGGPVFAKGTEVMRFLINKSLNSGDN